MSTVMARSTTKVSRDLSVRLGGWCLTGCPVEFVKVWTISPRCVALCLTMTFADDAVEVRKETRSLYFSTVSFVWYLLSEQPVYEVSNQHPIKRQHLCAVQFSPKAGTMSYIGTSWSHPTAPQKLRREDVMTKTPYASTATPLGSILSSSARRLRCCGWEVYTTPRCETATPLPST